MTKRERVRASIDRHGMDAIPWQFDLTSAVIGKLRTYWGVEDVRAMLDDHILFAGLAKPRDVPQPADPDLTRDELGAVWRRSARDYNVGDWGELVEHPLSEPSLKGFHFPDGSTPGRWDHVPELRRGNPDLYIVAGGCGLYEAGWALCGFQNYLGYIAGEPAFVEELTERLADFSCAVTRQLAGLGCDAVRFGDDWGFQDHLMIRPEQWRRIFKKQYARIYGAARDVGLVVSIHSCGNITEILPDLVDIGVQVVHPLQPEAMDVERCRRQYGKDLAFWGGLGSQSTLPLGTTEDVRREVRARLGQFRDGGYILAPAGAAPAETPAENIAAIVEVAQSQLR
jgi:uroporphyrinogen decarboxylase